MEAACYLYPFYIIFLLFEKLHLYSRTKNSPLSLYLASFFQNFFFFFYSRILSLFISRFACRFLLFRSLAILCIIVKMELTSKRSIRAHISHGDLLGWMRLRCRRATVAAACRRQIAFLYLCGHSGCERKMPLIAWAKRGDIGSSSSSLELVVTGVFHLNIFLLCL